MGWWIKSRRAHTALPAGLVFFLFIVILVQDTSIFLPSIAGRSQVALSLFVPVPLVAMLMLCIESRVLPPEVSGTRLVGLLDAVLITACLGTALILCMTADFLFDMPLAATAGRNAFFLAGVMLCGRAVAGQAAVMTPVAWLFLVVFVGFRGPNDPYAWTVVPEPINALHATLATVLIFSTGILIHLRTSRNVS